MSQPAAQVDGGQLTVIDSGKRFVKSGLGFLREEALPLAQDLAGLYGTIRESRQVEERRVTAVVDSGDDKVNLTPVIALSVGAIAVLFVLVK